MVRAVHVDEVPVVGADGRGEHREAEQPGEPGREDGHPVPHAFAFLFFFFFVLNKPNVFTLRVCVCVCVCVFYIISCFKTCGYPVRKRRSARLVCNNPSPQYPVRFSIAYRFCLSFFLTLTSRTTKQQHWVFTHWSGPGVGSG